MGFFSLSIPILLFASSLSLPPVSAAADTLTPGESISGNQTLVSAGGAFALGFFSPPGESVSGNRYLGTWYNTISNRTVVWVANRERPLIDPAGVFTVSDDRNLAVLDSNGSVIWSSAVDGVPSGTVAVLLDSGNLVLRQGDGRGLWQSFDHPTDTLLPGMKMGLNLRTGVAQRMVAWRAAGDPSPGAFSFGVDPRTTLQVITWRGSEPYWRSHVWNGWSSSSVRRINATAALYVLTYSRGSREASLAFSQTEVSAPARYVLEPTGTLKTLVWVEAMGYWGEAWSRPSMFCDPYNQCGPSGTCDSSGDPPTCRCLQGFVPRNQREWDRENYSGGCVRRVQLRCDRGDKFLRAERMKLPDRFTLVGNRTEGQCQAECLDSCRCTAYTYAKVREGPDSSRCLLWVGDLVDLEMVALGGEGLNVRLVASELVTDAQTDGSSGKNRSLMLILLPSLAAGVLLLGFLGYFLKRRIEKQRKRQISEFGYLNCSNTQVNKDTTEPPLMYFSTILAATNNFSAANKLGEGGFGPVYKGVLNTGQQIAIKRLSKDSGQGEEEFKNEVALIAKLQHRNLMQQSKCS